jgi:hypothetical protein
MLECGVAVRRLRSGVFLKRRGRHGRMAAAAAALIRAGEKAGRPLGKAPRARGPARPRRQQSKNSLIIRSIWRSAPLYLPGHGQDFTRKECIMDRENGVSELIELGVASADTKGANLIVDDSENGFKPPLGLSDD